MYSETVMNTERCDVKDTTVNEFTHLNSGWKRDDLTYNVSKYTADDEEADLPPNVIDYTMAQAFKVNLTGPLGQGS